MRKTILIFILFFAFTSAFATEHCESVTGFALLSELNRRMGRSTEPISTDPQSQRCQSITIGRSGNLCGVAEHVALHQCPLDASPAERLADQRATFWEASNVPVRCFTSTMNEDTRFQYSSCTGRAPASPGNIARGGTRTSGGRRPCVTNDYVANMWVAFHDVARCFNIEPRLMFPIIARESKFHMNASSSGGAQCAGQLTAGGYSGVISSICDRDNSIVQIEGITTVGSAIIRRGVGRASRSCTPEPSVDDALVPVGTPRRAMCDRVLANFEVTRSFSDCGLTQNPYTCLTYAFTHLNRDMATARAIIEKERSRATPRLSAQIFEDEEDLIRKVAVMSYNAGLQPLLLLQEFLRNRVRTGLSVGTNQSLAFSEFLSYARTNGTLSGENLDYVGHVQEQGARHGGSGANEERQVDNECSYF